MIKNTVLFFSLILFQSCTHTLYYGDATTELSNGELGPVQVYWRTTKPLIGELKTESISMNVACSAHLSFVQAQKRIVYYANPDTDVNADGQTISDQFFVCGELLDVTEIIGIKNDPIKIKMYCQPLLDDFSVQQKIYPSIDLNNHEIEISTVNEFSLTGKREHIPEPLECE